MLPFLLLFIWTMCVKGSMHPWYPVMMPISIGGTHHRHTTHVITHPVFRTKVLVVGDDDHDHYQQQHGRNHLHQHEHDQSNKQNIGQQHSHSHDQTSDNHDDGYRNPVVPYQEGPSNEISQRFKSRRFSVPVQKSSWKPIQKTVLTRGYLPLKYLGEDEERVSKAVRQALKTTRDKERESEPRPNLILPLGIKKLHNPQLRRPKHMYTKIGVTEGRYTYNPLLFRLQPWQTDKVTPTGLGTFRSNIQCHCQLPHI